MQLFFATTLLLSATLLFVVEPMFAKMVLPRLGGSPAVWNTCLVFYQAALLAGYVYAHVSIKWLGARRQAALHLAVLCLPWLAFVLPIGVAAGWMPPEQSNPVLWLWLLLTVSVGLPFFCVSATAPLVQAWFADTGHRSSKDPYFLYAASNVGSMVGLLAYPLVIESHLTLAQQSRWWAVGYAVLLAFLAGCAVWLWLSRKGAVSANEASPLPADPPPAANVELDDGSPTLLRRLRWVALAAVPSSLLLGVTAHLSVDIAPVPMLWVIPLELYLLSFVLVFARWRVLPHRFMVWMQGGLLVIVAAAYYLGGTSTSQVLALALLHLLAFFVTAMVCHGELAADRPAVGHLTEFFLWMSVGGVLGGLFNALLAPLLFKTVLEYPLMLVAACLLRPRPRWRAPVPLQLAEIGMLVASGTVLAMTAWSLGPERLESPEAQVGLVGLAALALARRPTRFAVAVAILAAVSFLCAGKETIIYRARSFFGVLAVKYTKSEMDGELYYEAHSLLHGSTLHGMQSLDEEDSLDPWTYYHRTGPVGDVMAELRSRPAFRKEGQIGVVGLGTGTTAAYGLAGQHLTYFEIDPAVLRIASDPRLFTYLRDCRDRKVDLNVRLGDARLTLQKEPDEKFDVLLVDAFSSDAIPIHLLTREAIQLYFQKLAEHGLLAVHISNRHLDLEPVLGNLAADQGLVARVRSDDEESYKGKCASTWVVLARHEQDFGDLDSTADWTPARVRDDMRPWTDDFSNIVAVVDWHFKWRSLFDWWPKKWRWHGSQPKPTFPFDHDDDSDDADADRPANSE